MTLGSKESQDIGATMSQVSPDGVVKAEESGDVEINKRLNFVGSIEVKPDESCTLYSGRGDKSLKKLAEGVVDDMLDPVVSTQETGTQQQQHNLSTVTATMAGVVTTNDSQDIIESSCCLSARVVDSENIEHSGDSPSLTQLLPELVLAPSLLLPSQAYIPPDISPPPPQSNTVFRDTGTETTSNNILPPSKVRLYICK